MTAALFAAHFRCSELVISPFFLKCAKLDAVHEFYDLNGTHLSCLIKVNYYKVLKLTATVRQ